MTRLSRQKLLACSVGIIITVVVIFTAIAGALIHTPRLVETIPLSDIENGESFTCTGLAYDEKENVFYVGNYGKLTPDEKEFRPTIVKLSRDFKRVSDEIRLYEIFPGIKGIQGVAVDASDSTLWFCCVDENKIRHIDSSGKDLGSIEFNCPVGLSYDSLTDTLWVLDEKELVNIKKDGRVIKTEQMKLPGQDQIFFRGDKIFITAGRLYNIPGAAISKDLNSNKNELYILKNSYAVEGVFVEDGLMYVLNDGYYHDAKIKENIVNIYSMK